MTAPEFAAALNGLVNSAMMNGVGMGKMNVTDLIAILETTKLDLVRTLQDRQREQVNNKIVKATRLPPIQPQ